MATLLGQKKGKNIQVSTDGQRLIYSASREYLVYDQSGGAGEGDVLITAGLPAVNLFYNFDGVPLALTCKKKSAQQWENNNKYWTVSAEFDNEPQSNEEGTGGNEGDSQDPTTWFSIVRFDFETYEETLSYLKNFAKRPYSPPFTVSRLIPVIKFTQYMPGTLTIYELINDYHEIVNRERFLNGLPGYWKLSIADAEFGITNGYECWRVDFELRYKKLTELLIFGQVVDRNGDLVSSDDDTDGGPMYPGWLAYIPQLDTIDINGNPFQDTKNNTGDIGKLDTDGTFLADQTDAGFIRQQGIYNVKSFNFIRIRQNNN
jgi:hypothetical protein